MNFQNKTVWITGASSGIGEALAKAFFEQGANLILSARREDELKRVKSQIGADDSRAIVLPLDLTDPACLAPAAETALAWKGHVDVLINNGGVSQRGLVQDTDMSVDRRLMEVNYFGAVALTKAVLPAMIARRAGHIVAISSVVGKYGFTLRSAYAASKHALDGFCESLLLEMRTHKIPVNVTVVSPGPIVTAISLNALTADGKPYGIMDEKQAAGMAADKAANLIIKGIAANKPEIYLGGKEVLMIYIHRFFPGLFRWIGQRAPAV